MNNSSLRNFRYFFLLGLVFFCIGPLSAFGSREKDKNADNSTSDRSIVQVTGIVRLTGTSLFPELVISGEETEWYVAKDEMNKLNDLQHLTVIVEGEETVTELFFANGTSAGIRRELSNIKIITIQQF